MQELFSIMTRKGQVTVPAAIREALGLKEGVRIAFSLPDTDNGGAMFRPIKSVADATYGAVKPRRRSEGFDELRHQFENDMGKEAMEGLER